MLLVDIQNGRRNSQQRRNKRKEGNSGKTRGSEVTVTNGRSCYKDLQTTLSKAKRELLSSKIRSLLPITPSTT